MSTDDLSSFFAMSAELTGFSEFELQATGVGEAYYQKLVDMVGLDTLDELYSAFAEQAIDDILTQPRLGPLAKNIIKMWYTGSWYPMPPSWRVRNNVLPEKQAQGASPVSGEAYQEGLVWRALDAHPMGARPQGYGAWSQPPGTWPNV
jgi:hypothetical protein